MGNQIFDFILNFSFFMIAIVIVIAIARSKNLLLIVILTGILTFAITIIYILFDAVDVAFTEIVVSTGISTFILLATVRKIGKIEKTEHNKNRVMRHTIAVSVVVGLGLILLSASFVFPIFGTPSSYSNNYLAPEYIKNIPIDFDIPNMVTAILAGYRSFDTMGETTVIFTAMVAVLSIIGISPSRSREHNDINEISPSASVVSISIPKLYIVTLAFEVLLPLYVIFALYVQAHGDFGPGGGFQAGVIFAISYLLYTLVFGVSSAKSYVPANIWRTFAAIGVIMYVGTGVVTVFLGGAFLDFSVLSSNSIAGQHLGILIVECGVGLCVLSSMILITNTFFDQYFETGRKKVNKTNYLSE